MAKKKTPDKFQIWIDARKRFHLSHAQIQMARELGMNPKNFGKLANHNQEPWKAPLPDFIERIYMKRFGREKPDQVRSIEQLVAANNLKKAERGAARGLRRNGIVTDLDRIKALSEQRDNENFEFCAFLKSECPHEKLDALVHRLYLEFSTAIDCLSCGNCCRESLPVLDSNDIQRFAQALGLTSEGFAGEYLKRSEEGGFTFRHAPCPFLDGKSCRNYDARPEDCRSYPHLQ